MLILLFLLAVGGMISFIVPIIKTEKYERDGARYVTLWTFAIILGLIAVGLLIAICCLSTKVASANRLENKIQMYTEENKNIESEIDRAVNAYMEHEKETFESVKTGESAITLVTLFPELKSDEIVKRQIDVYLENNKKIKELKEEKIDISKYRFILYFGR